MIREIHKNNDEIDALMNIWLASTIKGHPFIPEAYWQESYAVVRDTYLPNSETYVYTEGLAVKGFISIMEKNFIGALFVDVQAQRSGIGKRLIEFAAEKYGQLTLAVYAENEIAVNFYRKMGFEMIAEQANAETQELEYLMRMS